MRQLLLIIFAAAAMLCPAQGTAGLGKLTESDYREVAADLGIEVAAIKAVTDIEAGTGHHGFWCDSLPTINFDLAVFRSRARKSAINLDKYRQSHAVVFAAPNRAKYGSQQAAQQARLDAAKTIDEKVAIESTFWGMFQIGGFCWKLCGCQSPQDLVRRMCISEREQLNLFAALIKATGQVKYLQKKDWTGFARSYNGPGYAKRGYHTKMARAYNKFKE